jgi:hypothetical protein
MIGEVGGRLGHMATVAGRADATALTAGHRQGGPSMAPSCRAADGNAKGSHSCQARLSRAPTTNPVRPDMQTARAKPKQRSPHSRSPRSSSTTYPGTGRSAASRQARQLSRFSEVD